MESRNFQMDTEWNMIHYPDKPSGFGILIIGDDRHFVDEKSSFWTQNEGKAALLAQLKQSGYTVFYSNLYGKNWGSRQAVEMARSLYTHVVRNEIINEKIHIVAEGMGALVAQKLMDDMGHLIRSSTLINPILSLQSHLDQEKEHKFFYKKLMKELESSYQANRSHVLNEAIFQQEEVMTEVNMPVKIIHILSSGRAYKQSKMLKEMSVKWQDEEMPISISYMLPEKKRNLAKQIIHFIKNNEQEL
ncbi:hydrolase [Cytobacillus purgationiresistens]|uniref:Hydrolase n=1 Tax=Cytobacillus purgationiresistens TaxID=863449 RepID=A0ABU0ABX6_9BACI|nr:hydrolase [Cytobacillus purgationiresistens]MDQ0268754.1 hypothetical protein [Cytobacillus purgationiresistens]